MNFVDGARRAARPALAHALLLLAGSAWIAGIVGCADDEPAADQPSDARAVDGRFIHWVEHRIDDSGLAQSVRLKGADSLELADFDGDGSEDLVSVREDSDHVRLFFASDDPNAWTSLTLDAGPRVAGAEDPATGDLDGDGDVDVVVACEGGTLVYFENLGGVAARDPEQSARITGPFWRASIAKSSLIIRIKFR